MSKAAFRAAPDGSPCATPRDLFQFLIDEAASDRRTALVTVTQLTGASSRSLGAHLAVSASGAHRGSLSAGCVEAAIVAEALAAIQAGATRTVRFGAGSPYIDIRLPCGGGMDLLIIPDPDPAALRLALELLDQRRPVVLGLGRDGAVEVVQQPDQATGWDGGQFKVRHQPALRLMILGQGEEALALAALGRTIRADVVMLSPDPDLLSRGEALGATVHRLLSADASALIAADPWTAIIFLFHDHDWEPALLARLLAQPAFFVGAMGSRGTHAARLAALRDRGVSEAALCRIEAPLGLVPAARDPATLAVSALAQVVERWRDVAA